MRLGLMTVVDWTWGGSPDIPIDETNEETVN